MSEFDRNKAYDHEINGNWYTVVVYQWDDKIGVRVFAEEDGSKISYDDPLYVHLEYDSIVEDGCQDCDVSTLTSNAVNEAVCIFEEKQSEEEKFDTKIRAALEANEEVHGGIEYQLD